MHPKNALADVFLSVNSGESSYGVAAIENNVEGFVGETLDLLLEFNDDLQIIDMLWLPVQFDAVYASKETDSASSEFTGESVTPKVLKAHPHALAQCQKFIAKNHLNTQPALSNSAAVLDLRNGGLINGSLEGDKSACEIALAPHGSKAFKNVKVYEHLVQDFEHAKTQFVLIAKRSTADAIKFEENHNIWAITPDGDKPGTLLNILQVINAHSINISTLISRPIKAVDARYTFFLTLDASFNATSKCMQEISSLGNATFHLGYYFAKKERT